MELYLYKIGTSSPLLTLGPVASYTADQVVLEDGTVYRPLAPDVELSKTPDCSGQLRADWRSTNPGDQARLEDLEALMAELLFGGEDA